ncbi:MAG: hypothetical protein WD602_11145 [Actinomycetota bacterium]
MTEEKKDSKSMYETIMNVPGTKQIGAPPDKKKAADRILAAYQDSTSERNEELQKNLADSVNDPPKSIGERIEGE